VTKVLYIEHDDDNLFARQLRSLFDGTGDIPRITRHIGCQPIRAASTRGREELDYLHATLAFRSLMHLLISRLSCRNISSRSLF
jgi:hypothetical protein